MAQAGARAALAIVDTSVVVAALLSRDRRSPSSLIVRWMLDGRLEYVASDDLIREYRAVVARPAIMSRIPVPPEEVSAFIQQLVDGATPVEPGRIVAAPDSGDDHIWSILASGPEMTLVTRDRLLLHAVEAPGAVMTPAEFVAAYLGEP